MFWRHPHIFYLVASPVQESALLQSFNQLSCFFWQKKEKQVKLPVILVFVGLYLVCSCLYYSSFVDVFSALAAVCFAFSVAAKNPKLSRRWYVLNPICWMIYDIATKAYGNFIIHAVVFISTFSAILRLDLHKKGESKWKNIYHCSSLCYFLIV